MKKFAILFSALILVSIGFTSCGSDDPVLDEIIIKPGLGLNNLEIGDLGSQVEVELGTGFNAVINVGGSGNANYNYFNNAAGIDIIFGQQSSGDLDINTLPIQSFSLFDDFNGMTPEGIKIGSTRAEVIAAYGEPDEVDFWANVYYIGLIFSYDDLDLVQDITILEI